MNIGRLDNFFCLNIVNVSGLCELSCYCQDCFPLDRLQMETNEEYVRAYRITAYQPYVEVCEAACIPTREADYALFCADPGLPALLACL